MRDAAAIGGHAAIVTSLLLVEENVRIERVAGRMPCRNEQDVADYRRTVCTLATDYTGEEPGLIAIAEHPAWGGDCVPEQLVSAATALGFPSPSSSQWCGLSALQRFALVKLSRDGREYHNLGAALREFGLV